jgi:hypothetical protein
MAAAERNTEGSLGDVEPAVASALCPRAMVRSPVLIATLPKGLESLGSAGLLPASLLLPGSRLLL